MKLSQTTEWVILGALIVYIAFVPPIPAVRSFLSTAAGKLVGLVAVVSVWKYVSPIVAVLLLVSMVRCIYAPRESFTGAEKECTCKNPETFKWDNVIRKCRDSTGTEGEVESCACANGYTWDGGEKGRRECIPTSGNEPPIPPVIPTEANTVAPPVEPVPSKKESTTESGPAPAEKPTNEPTIPMTTPGAAQTTVSTSPSSTAVVGPTPGTLTSTPGSVG